MADALIHQFCVQRHVASFQVKRQKATAIFYLSKNLENLLPKLQQNKDLNNKIKEISQEVNFKLLPNNWHLWLNPHNLILIANWQTKQLCYIDSKNYTRS